MGMEKLWNELAVAGISQVKSQAEDRQPEKWNLVQACQGFLIPLLHFLI